MQQQRRSGLILGLVALGLLAGAALTAHPAQAVDAIGPYYATPAWDQKKAPVNRFVVLTNWNSAAVLDKETGLVWQQSPGGTATWHIARFNCINSSVGNRKGWRLPSIPELASLVDPSVTSGTTLPPGHPFTNVQSVGYWSATTDAEDPTNVWLVIFEFGGLVGPVLKTGSSPVWCVRGGMHADQY